MCWGEPRSGCILLPDKNGGKGRLPPIDIDRDAAARSGDLEDSRLIVARALEAGDFLDAGGLGRENYLRQVDG